MQETMRVVVEYFRYRRTPTEEMIGESKNTNLCF
jgi:hypothetical protein